MSGPGARWRNVLLTAPSCATCKDVRPTCARPPSRARRRRANRSWVTASGHRAATSPISRCDRMLHSRRLNEQGVVVHHQPDQDHHRDEQEVHGGSGSNRVVGGPGLVVGMPAGSGLPLRKCAMHHASQASVSASRYLVHAQVPVGGGEPHRCDRGAQLGHCVTPLRRASMLRSWRRSRSVGGRSHISRCSDGAMGRCLPDVFRRPSVALTQCW